MRRIGLRLPLSVFLIGLSGIILSSFFAKDPYELPSRVDYNFHVRPILSSKCYTCHGPDSSSRKSGLRLDIRAAAISEAESGKRAIVPGNISKSELLVRISHHDPEIQMPPPENNAQLSGREIAILKKWIKQGAKWAPHWAFVAPTMPDIDKISRNKDIANEIDYFIQAKLKEKGLASASVAHPYELLRRLSFVSTGLPPTKEEIQAFVGNSDLINYEAWVDYYLNSPKFGERWARHWMDLSRYAESRGHEFDYDIHEAWRYRDYLINAFNDDVPYDQFVTEQLAGDLLEHPRIHPQKGYNQSLRGTNFHTLGEGKHSPVDIKEEEMFKIDNLIDVSSKTFMGLTVGCARCHDHKFDPIPTRDYYSMYGIFESARPHNYPANINTETIKQLQRLKSLQGQLRDTIAEAWLRAINPLPDKRQQTHGNNESTILPSDSIEWIADFRNGSLGNWRVNGEAFSNHYIGWMEYSSDSNSISRLNDAAISTRSLGRGIHGALRSPTFTIKQDSIDFMAAGYRSSLRLVIDNFQLIQWPIYGNLGQEIHSEHPEIYRFRLDKWKGHKAYFEAVPGTFSRHQYQLDSLSWLDLYYSIAYSGNNPPIKQSINHQAEGNIEEAINQWKKAKAKPSEIALINSLLARGTLSKRLSSYSKSLLDSITRISASLYDPAYFEGVVADEQIRSKVFHRGNHHQLIGEEVPHYFSKAVFPDEAPYDSLAMDTRLKWAESLFEEDNPLSSRVIVNRIWHYIFGKGIVETVDNFGLQGKLPSHPELLDFLAIKFREDGWSMKTMIKYMLLSNTFMQSSTSSTQAEEIDPQNIFLSHYPVRRLEGEAIRDAILSASGCLNEEMFGPSIPVHLTSFMNGRGRPFISGPLDGAGRRSIYTAIRRNFLPPFMTTFDMPTPFTTFGKRNITNIPAQSLTLMNDPFVIEQASMWSTRIMNLKDKDWKEKVEQMYFEAFSMPPTNENLELAKAFFKQQAIAYNLCEDEWENHPDIWKDYAHSLINSKQFIYLL